MNDLSKHDQQFPIDRTFIYDLATVNKDANFHVVPI